MFQISSDMGELWVLSILRQSFFPSVNLRNLENLSAFKTQWWIGVVYTFLFQKGEIGRRKRVTGLKQV